jgi:hypothetical protein
MKHMRRVGQEVMKEQRLVKGKCLGDFNGVDGIARLRHQQR